MTTESALRQALQLIAAQDQGCGGNVTEAEAWRSAQAIARAALAAQAAPSEPVAQNEYSLRLMLCMAYAGSAAYMDDGELQDNSRTPFIDFLRDPPNVIQRKIIERNLAAPPPPAAPAVAPGFALVPKHMTQAMRDVTDTEDWTWEDLLAAAEAITEAEYDEIAAAPAVAVEPAGSDPEYLRIMADQVAAGLHSFPERERHINRLRAIADWIERAIERSAPAQPAPQRQEDASAMPDAVEYLRQHGMTGSHEWRNGFDACRMAYAHTAALAAAPSPQAQAQPFKWPDFMDPKQGPVIAQAQAQQGLTDERIEQGWRDTFSTSNPFCPCDLKTFTKATRWADRELRASTAAAPSPVPAGWQLVPREPTPEMIEAASLSVNDNPERGWESRAYRAMLFAAAPRMSADGGKDIPFTAAPGAPTPAPKGTT
jgi:hypothetical protein